ncbi:mycothiol conjugate amidase Mca [Lacisediminihabitans changchengi]|uniref:mycothiol conjugate amidase Mca n=1 Tax=Lacisediminihabitans changchengi TaxID=2787634 RepID=UPI0027DC7C79|nr:mycothiol conjugate amidase Mca [Lacisediminihabitans changchengi]
MTLRLLAVHAHPDDESSKGAGTYARYVSAGAEVMVVSCTGGERGDIQNEDLAETAMADRDMAGLRRIEMARAQAAVGFEHRWLGYVDSGLPENGEAIPRYTFADIPLEFSAEPLVKIIREFRPQVLVAYDENGGYPHPDHIRAHQVAIYAMEAAADATRYPQSGAPWQIVKVYYDRIFNTERITAMHGHLQAEQPDSPLIPQLGELLERWGDRPSLATTHIDVSDHLDTRDRALRSHSSQVPPDSLFFFWPNDLQRAAWPFEDFELVTSLVDTPTPETDLFAGIIDEGTP